MDELISLSNATLDQLAVERPRYDRTTLQPGIVHIGVGNFHRAHQAWYLHRLMQEGKAHDWAIIGAGVRPYDAAMREKLLAQDCLTTLIELDPKKVSAEVIGSMIDYLPIEDGNGALIITMAEPAIRIVAMTVTESGYYIDPVTKEFDSNHPDIQHDAAHPDSPRTAFGAMVAALRLRRDARRGAFTGLSCDNLQGNGDILRQTVVSLARLSDPDLADWIDANATFPNSMVDCIAPATGPNELALAKDFGIDDDAVVTHEAFRQWVIEDNFCAGRPDWDAVGATFSDDVHAFETMKIRILNAGHQVLANVGEVLGLRTISECMQHSVISSFFGKVQRTEIAPTVAAVPGKSPAEYISLIESRFSNPRIVDTTRRVAFDGSARHTGFVLPILRDQLQAGRSVEGLALVEALWARMCAGTREDGSVIEANDPIWDQLSQNAFAAASNPAVWLNQGRIYGELSEAGPFSDAFSKWLTMIWANGCEAALIAYVDDA
ncbi:mannitol dehydrogenase family protein [Ruegeria sp. HKCCD6228]|uniref:Mannitol dehydrogenase family protein n=1 Tax=Ruegeria atlantica TaxID=81569 RepID=A0AA90YUR9_9RHOB|nr:MULTISPECIES: mannitol dehydrogenase family protein [Ruegeria]NOC83111.1 mannitol dehydrogenase family protein [Ruegeria sp. HKCCD6428]NOC94382.1 mannitol dehydrogenase family protein [Ruegeria sp. HKCCD6604]NOD97631.1 mannitol dehydrogenase family protein [Ruegeria sp. HKCCD6228]NOE19598.1 mannitol dehydrogenase family protein [Ruegeria atlantica]